MEEFFPLNLLFFSKFQDLVQIADTDPLENMMSRSTQA